MRLSALLIVLVAEVLSSCGDEKVYQKYADLEERNWLVSDTAEFEFTVPDTLSSYNVYCYVRNSTEYPYARIFIDFAMADTTGTKLHSTLLNDFLFDPKSGKPFGKSGLGDLYDHQLDVLKNYRFERSGPFRVRMTQMMRRDTLKGVLSVGLGIERVEE
jgi:gliding motility-associated lipoprotein GldH